MDDECIVCFNKVKCDSASEIFDKKCKCEYLIHDECLKKWLTTSPTCLICHNILLIKPTMETTNASQPTPPITEVDIEALVYEIPENNTVLTTAEAIQHINQAKIRLYACLFIIMCIIIFSYRL